MMTAYDIVIRPIITERAMAGAADKKYVFEVAKSAGKVEIKKAVEEIFGVKVASVNTLNVPAKAKRMGAGRPGRFRGTLSSCTSIDRRERITMNQKELNEIRRRFKLDKNSISKIFGC